MNEWEELEKKMKDNDKWIYISAAGVLISVIVFVVVSAMILDVLGLLD